MAHVALMSSQHDLTSNYILFEVAYVQPDVNGNKELSYQDL